MENETDMKQIWRFYHSTATNIKCNDRKEFKKWHP